MKGILEFTLPEDHEAFEAACNGSIVRAVLQDLWEHLRARRKYNDLDTLRDDELEQIQQWLLKHIPDLLEE